MKYHHKHTCELNPKNKNSKNKSKRKTSMNSAAYIETDMNVQTPEISSF